MSKLSFPATAEGMSKISPHSVMSQAWADYRRDEFKGWGVRRGEPFNRGHFAYCLRMAWAVAKEVAARKPAPAPVAKVCADPVRAAKIRTELRDMELFSDFMDWSRRATLGAELARLGA